MPFRPRIVIPVVALVLLTATACSQVVDGRPVAAPSSAPTSTASSSPSPTASPSPSSTPPAPTVEPADFHPCPALLTIQGVKIESALKGKLTADCTQIDVPLDYNDPSGRTLPIAVTRFHDSDNSGHTPLFVNPGGPGASGVQLALGLLGKLPPVVLQHYDLLGFDPRGAALSAPITCQSASQEDAYLAASPDVTTAAGFAAAKRRAAGLAQECEQRMGSALQFYNTVNSAKDMDVLRTALGVAKLDYLGYSYGTELGSVYAHLFPSRVGAMVLDGAVDPLTSGITQGTFQLGGFERAYGQFGAYCRRTAPCSSLGDPVAAAVAIEAAAARSPLPTGTSRRLTRSLAANGIEEAMYARSEWPLLGQALVQAHDGNGAGLLTLAERYAHRGPNGQYDNLLNAFTAISCNDTAPGPDDATIRRTAQQWASNYPVFGKFFAIDLFDCQSWQPHRVVPPKPTADTATKVLIVGNVHDPATPYQGAKNLTRTMGDAELLSWDGQGHTSYLSGSKCVDNYVDQYLINRRLPPQNTTCPAS